MQEALRLAPEEADARLALALIYEGRGKRSEALDEARRALSLRPDSDEILRKLADLLVDDGRTEPRLSTPPAAPSRCVPPSP